MQMHDISSTMLHALPSRLLQCNIKSSMAAAVAIRALVYGSLIYPHNWPRANSSMAQDATRQHIGKKAASTLPPTIKVTPSGFHAHKGLLATHPHPCRPYPTRLDPTLAHPQPSGTRFGTPFGTRFGPLGRNLTAIAAPHVGSVLQRSQISSRPPPIVPVQPVRSARVQPRLNQSGLQACPTRVHGSVSTAWGICSSATEEAIVPVIVPACGARVRRG
jgi:hypothetical protein